MTAPLVPAGLTDSGALKLFLALSVTRSDTVRILRWYSVAASKAPRATGHPRRVMLIRGFGSHSRIDWRGGEEDLASQGDKRDPGAGEYAEAAEGMARGRWADSKPITGPAISGLL